MLVQANSYRWNCIQTAGAGCPALWHDSRWRLASLVHHIATVGHHGQDCLRQLLGYTPDTVRKKHKGDRSNNTPRQRRWFLLFNQATPFNPDLTLLFTRHASSLTRCSLLWTYRHAHYIAKRIDSHTTQCFTCKDLKRSRFPNSLERWTQKMSIIGLEIKMEPERPAVVAVYTVLWTKKRKKKGTEIKNKGEVRFENAKKKEKKKKKKGLRIWVAKRRGSILQQNIFFLLCITRNCISFRLQHNEAIRL